MVSPLVLSASVIVKSRHLLYRKDNLTAVKIAENYNLGVQCNECGATGATQHQSLQRFHANQKISFQHYDNDVLISNLYRNCEDLMSDGLLTIRAMVHKSPSDYSPAQRHHLVNKNFLSDIANTKSSWQRRLIRSAVITIRISHAR